MSFDHLINNTQYTAEKRGKFGTNPIKKNGINNDSVVIFDKEQNETEDPKYPPPNYPSMFGLLSNIFCNIGDLNNYKGNENLYDADALGALYKDYFDGKTKDGELEDTKQRHTGDCWFLSATNSLGYTEAGREIINNAFEYKKDGTYVNLKGLDNKYFISNEELILTKGSKQYSSGDDDMVILELAMEKALDDYAKGNYVFDDDASALIRYEANVTKPDNSSLEGGFAVKAYYFLTGKTGEYLQDAESKNNAFNTFQQNNGKDYVMCLAGNFQNGDENSKTFTDVNGKACTLPENHEYAVKKVTDDTATITNPWDSSKEIVLSREDVLNNFNVEYCDLSDNNPPQILTQHLTSALGGTVEINGVEYNRDYKLKDDGSVYSTLYHSTNSKIGIKTVNYNNNGIKYTLDFICSLDDNGNVTRDSILTEENSAQKIFERDMLNLPNSQDDPKDICWFVGRLSEYSDEEWSYAKNLLNQRQSDGSYLTPRQVFCLTSLKPEYLKQMAAENNFEYLDAYRWNKCDGKMSSIIEGMDDVQLERIIKRGCLALTRPDGSPLTSIDLFYLSDLDDAKWKLASNILNSYKKIGKNVTGFEIYNLVTW